MRIGQPIFYSIDVIDLARNFETMGIQDRAEATAKNLEGKGREAYGEATGDTSEKAKGKAKQTEAKAEHAKEDMKDEVKKRLD
jgi:uncharacterized protein YjbJ (UPF0337 family)